MRTLPPPTSVFPRPGPAERGARLREAGLLLGFLLLVAGAVVTVAIPELSKDPDQGAARSAPAPAPATPRP
jgi:hypothetical protein